MSTPPPVNYTVALSKVTRYLSALRGYRPEAAARFAEVVQLACVSVEHVDAVLNQFGEECPTPREIRDIAFNLREKFLPKQPPQTEQWEKQYGPPDPDWSRKLLGIAKVQISAVDRKAQHKAELRAMKIQALKDSVFYASPAGQAEIDAIVGKVERNGSRQFWAQAIYRNEREYPVQIAAIRAGREPEFSDEYKPTVVPMRPITSESFRKVEPMRIEKCTTCGGSGRLAGDDYCDDCQTGRDLRRMELPHSNGKDGAA